MSKTIIKRGISRKFYYVYSDGDITYRDSEFIGEETVSEYENSTTLFDVGDCIFVSTLEEKHKIISKCCSLNGDVIYYIPPKTIKDEVTESTKQMAERASKIIKELLKEKYDMKDEINKLAQGFWGKRKARKLGINI